MCAPSPEAHGANALGPSVAGYRALVGTERPLSGTPLLELEALVAADDGFDDGVTRRCRPGTSVGFTLDREDGASASALVLDFGCNRLVVDDADAEPEVTATYFDPARAAFVDLVKRAFPTDAEIRVLRP